MTLLDAIEAIEGEDADPDDNLEAWQLLHDTGMAYTLQGWYGRTAQRLLAEGLIT